MRRETKERGVTLVALIITVIILVILAAISINQISEHRIAETAINGTESHVIEDIKERIVIAINEALVYSFDEEEIKFRYEMVPEETMNLLTERRIYLC